MILPNGKYMLTKWQLLSMMLIILIGSVIGMIWLTTSITSRIATNAAAVVEAKSYVLSHAQETKLYGARIDALERQVAALQTKGSARADPFTGSEGRALEERITFLENFLLEIGPVSTDDITRGPSEAQ